MQGLTIVPYVKKDDNKYLKEKTEKRERERERERDRERKRDVTNDDKVYI